MFTRRQSKILELLLNNVQGVNGEKIAKYLNVSSRTVRNEISEINRMWKAGAIIQANRKTGYFIEEKDREPVRECLMQQSESQCETFDAYREWRILGMALEEGRTDLFTVSEALALSEAAIAKELVKLQKHLETEYQCTMLRVSAEMIWIDAEERFIRQTLFKIIKNELSAGTRANQHLLEAILAGSFDVGEYGWMLTLIKEYFDEEMIQISDVNLYLIVSAVYVTMVRNYQNHTITSDSVQEKKDEHNVVHFFEFLNEQSFELNDADLDLLGELLYGFKMSSRAGTEQLGDGFSAFILDEFCSAVMKNYQLDLWQSQEFYENMLNHMEYMIRRMETGYTTKNPMLNDIKKQYPYAYEVSMLLVPIIQKYKNCYIQDDELCYIAIFVEHFLENVNQRLKAVIIGSTRFSVNTIIHNWVEKNFKNQIEVLSILPMHSLEKYLQEHPVDLILSTVDSYFHPNIKTFVITGIPDHDTQTAMNALIYKIRKNYRFHELIKEVFHEKTILFFQEKAAFDEVIWELARALEKEGCLENVESYVEDVLQREVNYPTDVGDWFMIPHPLMNFAKKTAIGVAVLKKPIYIHKKEIRLIFLLAMEQRLNEQVGVLFQFFKHMALEQSFIGMLSSAETEKAFINTLIQISDFTEIS